MKLSILPVTGEKVRIELFKNELITERYASWLRDERVNKYLVSGSSTTTLEEIKSYVRSVEEKETDYFFAIIDKEKNIHFGNVRLQVDPVTRIGQYSMMIGDVNYHGRGFGTEVVRLVLKISFEQLMLDKVFCEVVAENFPAVRIYEKNGFVIERQLKNHFYKNGRYYDFLVMSIYKANFR